MCGGTDSSQRAIYRNRVRRPKVQLFPKQEKIGRSGTEEASQARPLCPTSLRIAPIVALRLSSRPHPFDRPSQPTSATGRVLCATRTTNHKEPATTYAVPPSTSDLSLSRFPIALNKGRTGSRCDFPDLSISSPVHGPPSPLNQGLKAKFARLFSAEGDSNEGS